MTPSKTLTRAAAVLSLAGALAGAGASSAAAQSYRAPTGGGLGSIVSCDAPGGKQAGGAVIGALLGAVAGSNLAKNDRGTGTAIGAVAGAATGSYVGCKMQRDRAAKSAYTGVYSRGGYQLSNAIAPASYQRDGGRLIATTSLNLRQAPTVNSPRVGGLVAGESFDAMARVRGTDWILVGRDGVGVGYVLGAYTRPAGRQYASYGY